MLLIAAQKQEVFCDWYNLIFLHDHKLYTSRMEITKESDIVCSKVISIDSDIDFNLMFTSIEIQYNHWYNNTYHSFNEFRCSIEAKQLIRKYERKGRTEAQH